MKALLRKEMIARRDALSDWEAESFSQRISASVLHWILRDAGVDCPKADGAMEELLIKGLANPAALYGMIADDTHLRGNALLQNASVLGYMAARHEVDVTSLMRALQGLGARIALPRVLDREHMEFYDADLLKDVHRLTKEHRPSKDRRQVKEHKLIGGCSSKAGNQSSGLYLSKSSDYANDPSFETSGFGILEPRASLEAVDLTFCKRVYLLMPCVGLNSSGHRLGYGAGYYDRYFHPAFEKKLRYNGIDLVKIAPVYDFQRDLEFANEEHDLSADIVISDGLWRDADKRR